MPSMSNDCLSNTPTDRKATTKTERACSLSISYKNDRDSEMTNNERYVGPPLPDGSRWRVCSDMGDTFVLVPEDADGAATERAVRGTALQRWQDGQAANEVFGPGGAW